jgi:hypothetical protein
LENDSGTLTEGYRETCSRNKFNDFPPQNPSRCEPVNLDVCACFRGDLTQCPHSSEQHLRAYFVVFCPYGSYDSEFDQFHEAPSAIGLRPKERFRRIVGRLTVFRHAAAIGCRERGLQLQGVEVLGVAGCARLLAP